MPNCKHRTWQDHRIEAARSDGCITIHHQMYATNHVDVGRYSINQAVNDNIFETLIDSEKAAKLLGGIHPKTLQKKAREGAVPSHLVFGRRFFRASELDTWLRVCENSSSQSARLEVI